MVDKIKIAEKFADVTVDDDVGLMLVQYDKIDEYDCRLEMWCLDHILGHSAIFLTSEIENINDVGLWFKEKTKQPDPIIIKNVEQFTFLNYGFSEAEGLSVSCEPEFRKIAREKWVLKKALE